jgi:uncharacterized protein YebE (UPF0316 family)
MSQVSASASLKWVVVAIAFNIVNVFFGAWMAFFRRDRKYLNIHKWLFYAIVFCLGYFLVLNHIHSGNTVWQYLICGYFITVIPLSKRWDVLLHALAGVLGLLLLPVILLL